MKYKIIQPPFSLDFRAMKRKEAVLYFEWFIKQIPTRVAILEKAVTSTQNYEKWKADCTPWSLNDLGYWFYNHIKTESRTQEDIEQIYTNSPNWFKDVEVEDWKLATQTISFAIDIGMYLSKVFTEQNPILQWKLVTKPKNSSDFHQPVLSGFSDNDVLNPVQIMITLGYGFTRKSRGPERLTQIYETWVKLLE